MNRANNSPVQPTRAGTAAAAKWLTLRRVRAHAIVLALCLWGVCAVDFATPGIFDRVGNIKFQDFLPIYVSAQLIAQNRAGELYASQIAAESMRAVVHQLVSQPPNVRLPYLYGPQVALSMAPLSRFSFPVAARIWVVISLLLYAGCIYLVWNTCAALRPHRKIVAVCAIAFPPLFHFFVRGQLSALVLACFTAAFLAFRMDRNWLAGLTLGFLIFKPQFLIAIPLVLILAQEWQAFAGFVLAAAAQLAFTAAYFGSGVMHAYFDVLWHVSRALDAAELSLAPIQMHSLRAFWSLLFPSPQSPWPEISLVLYVLSAIVTVGMAAFVWKSSSPLALRFSALSLAAVLVNPHLFIYDLLVLAPALLLVVDWTIAHAQSPASALLRVLAYAVFIVPLFGPLSRWTHVQLSVPVFVALLWTLWRHSRTAGHKLDSAEPAVV
jgi:hypothetical protein